MAKKQENFLEIIPIPSPRIYLVNEDDGLISIAFPRFRKKWMAKMLLPPKKKNEIKVKLDAHGTRIWKRIDGKKNVQTILDELSEIAQQEENYNNRILLFLQQLFASGFLITAK